MLGEPTIAEATRSFPTLNNTTPGQMFTAFVSTSKCVHISGKYPECFDSWKLGKFKTDAYQFHEHVDYLSCFWSSYSSMRSESNVCISKENINIEL